MTTNSAEAQASDFVQRLKRERANRLRVDLAIWGGMMLVALVVVLLSL